MLLLKEIKKIAPFGHSEFRKYFSNTAWIMAERFIRLFVVLLVGIYVARYLGPKRLGILNYAISFVGLFSELATLGLDRIVVREIVRDESRGAVILGTVFWLRLMGALLILSIIMGVLFFLPDDPLTKLIVLIVALSMIFQAFSIIDFYFQAKVLSKYVVFANIL